MDLEFLALLFEIFIRCNLYQFATTSQQLLVVEYRQISLSYRRSFTQHPFEGDQQIGRENGLMIYYFTRLSRAEPGDSCMGWLHHVLCCYKTVIQGGRYIYDDALFEVVLNSRTERKNFLEQEEGLLICVVTNERHIVLRQCSSTTQLVVYYYYAGQTLVLILFT